MELDDKTKEWMYSNGTRRRHKEDTVSVYSVAFPVLRGNDIHMHWTCVHAKPASTFSVLCDTKNEHLIKKLQTVFTKENAKELFGSDGMSLNLFLPDTSYHDTALLSAIVAAFGATQFLPNLKSKFNICLAAGVDDELNLTPASADFIRKLNQTMLYKKCVVHGSSRDIFYDSESVSDKFVFCDRLSDVFRVYFQQGV